MIEEKSVLETIQMRVIDLHVLVKSLGRNVGLLVDVATLVTTQVNVGSLDYDQSRLLHSCHSGPPKMSWFDFHTVAPSKMA